jgi:hypothetical protein
MQSGFRKLLSAAIVALALAVGWFAGADTARAQGVIVAAADLLPVGGQADPNVPSSVATFAEGQAGSVIVTVNLRGQQPNAGYVATIRDDACDGAVLYTLTDVQTDASGMGEASTELKAAVEVGRWHVEVSPAGGAASNRLCGAATQAIVSGPAVNPSGDQTGAPGLPRTGGQADLLWQAGAVLLVAVVCVMIGWRLRIANKKQI